MGKTTSSEVPADYRERIKSVAEQIQTLLRDNGMVMTPSIQIGLREDTPMDEMLSGEGDPLSTPSGIIVPPSPPPIITPDNNLMNKADFMQP